MRKTITTGIALLMALGMVAAPATAKKKGAKLIPVTLYAHGTSQFGEQDQNATTGTFLRMDPKKPTGSSSKSIGIFGIGAAGTGTPNRDCAGNPNWPVWIGSFSGTVSGSMKFTFYATALPGAEVEVRVWPDVGGQLCNDQFIEPARTAVVALPSTGAAEVTLEGVDFSASAVLLVQINPTMNVPALGRIMYDSSAEATKLEFTCIPERGKKSCV